MMWQLVRPAIFFMLLGGAGGCFTYTLLSVFISQSGIISFILAACYGILVRGSP